MSADVPDGPSGQLFVISTVLLGLSVALLPAWDGVHRPGWLAFAVVAAGVTVGAFLRLKGRARWVVLGLSVLFIVLYSIFSSGSLLLERSRLVDRLPACETGAAPAGVAPLPSGLVLEGPHLANGTPCVNRDEDRDHHREWDPNGDLADGFRQVLTRFPGDETQMLLGPMAALFLAAFAGVLLAKAGAAPRME